jgi:(E)-4-hydroxy-3-methylbut-2-enyl-diphosphate synthase
MKGFPLFTLEEFNYTKQKSYVVNFVKIMVDDIFKPEFRQTANGETVVFVLETKNNHGMAEQRRVFTYLREIKIKSPVIIKRKYSQISEDDFLLYASTDFGALLTDGYGDGVWAETEKLKTGEKKENFINRTLFGILQAARVRISKTEYIACPSCGRTLFDLVEVTGKIRKVTGHLKGVKIAIMGCIVNGPGEMADADYGYVGSGVNKITLYRGKEVVKRNVNSDNAVNELIELIKEDNLWNDSV